MEAAGGGGVMHVLKSFTYTNLESVASLIWCAEPSKTSWWTYFSSLRLSVRAQLSQMTVRYRKASLGGQTKGGQIQQTHATLQNIKSRYPAPSTQQLRSPLCWSVTLNPNKTRRRFSLLLGKNAKSFTLLRSHWRSETFRWCVSCREGKHETLLFKETGLRKCTSWLSYRCFAWNRQPAFYYRTVEKWGSVSRKAFLWKAQERISWRTKQSRRSNRFLRLVCAAVPKQSGNKAFSHCSFSPEIITAFPHSGIPCCVQQCYYRALRPEVLNLLTSAVGGGHHIYSVKISRNARLSVAPWHPIIVFLVL